MEMPNLWRTQKVGHLIVSNWSLYYEHLVLLAEPKQIQSCNASGLKVLNAIKQQRSCPLKKIPSTNFQVAKWTRMLIYRSEYLYNDTN